MKVGFIGLGNMATAILGGMLKNKVVTKEDVIGSDPKEEARKKVEETFDIQTTDSNKDVVNKANIVILAVKPGILANVIAQIHEEDISDTLFISIAAGKSIAWIEEQFGKKISLVRFMPNTPALVGAGCTAVCGNGYASKEDLENALFIAKSFGTAEVVDEKLMDTISAVSSCSPAYVFMMIEAMADAGVKGGMPRDQAYRFASQAVMGSARLVLESGKHPAELKDMVCSPGGTTIEGVSVLEKDGFRAALMDAIDASIEKAKKL